MPKRPSTMMPDHSFQLTPNGGLSRWRCLVGVVLVVALTACGGSPTGPTTGREEPDANLRFVLNEGRASFWGAELGYSYSACYLIQSATIGVGPELAIERVDYSVIGPNGDVYFSESETRTPSPSYGIGGCSPIGLRYDTRPAATTYTMRIAYRWTSGDTRLRTAVRTGVLTRG